MTDEIRNGATMPRLRAAIHLARDLLLAGEDAVATKPELLLLAEGVALLGDALRHYENAITWDITCTTCATLLDRLHVTERSLDEARAAWLAAIVRRADAEGLGGDEPACEHQKCVAVMERTEGRTPVVFWCRDCGALGGPQEWRLPGAEP